MRRIYAAFLVIVLLFTFVSCKRRENKAVYKPEISAQSETEIIEKNSETEIEETFTLESTKEPPKETEDSDHAQETFTNEPGAQPEQGGDQEQQAPSDPSNDENDSDPSKDPASDANIQGTFHPTVIASRCSHQYVDPTCTSLVNCTICGEKIRGLYKGNKVGYGHYYKDKKCLICGFEYVALAEVCLNRFSVNQPLVCDIYLSSQEKYVSAYPCVSIYRFENNEWVPYNGMYELGEFFALDATYGGVLEENGIKYGRWDYMTNEALKTDPNACLETEFASARLIRRFKFSIPEEGQYKIDITDGPNDSMRPEGATHQYMMKVY